MAEHNERTEMENQPPGDPTAATRVYQADVGRSTGYGSTPARVDGVTTSPKIARHDRPYEMLRNRFNDLESPEVGALLEICYGKSVYEAARENFASFKEEVLRDILEMNELEVEELLDELLEEDEEEDDE